MALIHDWQKKNQRLQKLVQRLLDRINDNQRIDGHFKQFEFKLLSCRSLSELMDTLLQDSLGHFQLEDVGLILIDRDFSLADMLRKLDIGHFKNRLQLRNNEDFAHSLYPGRYQVSLGDVDALSAARLFPNLHSPIGSAALMPLLRQEQLLGSLNFASSERERFSEDKAVDFMHHLASISAVCLENCLAHEHLRHQSRVDRLTQVSNRMHFDNEFGKELERAERAKDPLTCLFVDLDYFKRINDQFGHAAGDACLKQVAQVIEKQLRKTDLLCRYGGEEFVVLLSRCDQAGALPIAERIRAAVEKLKIEEIKPTVSIGLSSWQPTDERSDNLAKLGEDLLKCADEALYQAKGEGRNRVVVKAF